MTSRRTILAASAATLFAVQLAFAHPTTEWNDPTQQDVHATKAAQPLQNKKPSSEAVEKKVEEKSKSAAGRERASN